MNAGAEMRGIDYIGVGVGAALFDAEGKIFLTLRGPDAKNERGRWEIPGGSVEFGETLEAALAREMMEEYGVEIAVHGLLGIFDHILPDEGQHWVSPTYMCAITAGIPMIREPAKCAAIGWFTLDEAALLPLSTITANDIRLLREKGRSEVFGERSRQRFT
jgi:8-oxo-dGTP diphosphatase